MERYVRVGVGVSVVVVEPLPLGRGERTQGAVVRLETKVGLHVAVQLGPRVPDDGAKVADEVAIVVVRRDAVQLVLVLVEHAPERKLLPERNGEKKRKEK